MSVRDVALRVVCWTLLGWSFLGRLGGPALGGEPLTFSLRSQTPVAEGAARYHTTTQSVTWNPAETAIVVCDMWDTHTCPNAALRVSQMAPRMNEVLKAARAKGIFIIHAPSDTMKFYEGHPGRKLAMAAPMVEPIKPLQRWCKIDPEHEAPLPIDDSDGGCDCERTWKPGDPYPWTRQIATLEIMDGDAITDSAEAYYLLKQRGIKNLIVMGVHTNMCVLGRPFSIRQMVYQGLNVALMRDMTDTMYNPAMAPYVSHFTGTDLVVSHIERHWCPTLLSGDFLDGEEYRFPADTRPHVVIVQGEEEYQTATTLPKFAMEHLGKDYRVSYVWLDEASKASFPGMEMVKTADLVLLSVRRRNLPAEQLAILQAFVAAGKPVVGLRTASHAFHQRNAAPPDGLAEWRDIDAVLFGGNYRNHHGNGTESTVSVVAGAEGHPVLQGLGSAAFPSLGGLYQTGPLREGTTELLRGKIAGVEQAEPVAWTFTRKDGGRSFYTSLGHPSDYERPELATLLKNAIAWLLSEKSPAVKTSQTSTAKPMAVPGTWHDLDPALKDYDGFAWYQVNVQLPAGWTSGLYLYVEKVDNACETYFNGVKIGISGKFPPNYESGLTSNQHRYVIPPDIVRGDGPNHVAIRVYDHDGNAGFKGLAPHILRGNEAVSLAGTWRFERGDDPAWGRAPLAEYLLAPAVIAAPELSRFATVIGRRAQDTPRTAEESLAGFKIPEDLAVDIVLTEPVITQPVFLNFDERGRLWVLNYEQYPEPAGLKLLSKDQWWRAVYDKVPLPPPHGEKGRDKITIHEDTDGDGTFETHKTFVDGLNIATSFAQGRGGVFVLNPPYLLFYADKNGDDVPDGDPEVLLEGFGLEDTHSVVNSLRWGPDGWLYSAQGSTVSGAVRRPGEKSVVHTQGQNIWRYHPETKRYEVFAEGGGNAFSVEFDAAGRCFSGHNGGNTRGFHYMQGAYLQKGFGKHGPLSNPYAFGYFPMMEHGDYARFTHNFIIYEGDALPEKYRGVLFGVNPINSHVVMSERTAVGSTFKTRDLGYAIESADSWFRPVDIKDGPDGNIYVADWYDGQLAHTANYQGGMDRERGRIYRIRAKESRVESRELKAKTTMLANASPETLSKALSHPNRWQRQTALRLMADAPPLDGARPGHELLEAETAAPLETIWSLHAQQFFGGGRVITAIVHPHPGVREWAWRLWFNANDRLPERMFAPFLIALDQETDREVLCQIACSSKRIGKADQALPILARLLKHSELIDDPRYALLLWWSLEAKVTTEPAAVVELFSSPELWGEPIVIREILPRLMRRFAATGQRADLTVCTKLLTMSPSPEATAALMRGFEEAYQGRSLTNVPAELVTALSQAGGGSLALKIRQGDAAAIREALAALADEKTPSGKRVEYATLFGEVRTPESLEVMLDRLVATPDDAVRIAILTSLPAYADERIPTIVLEQYPKWIDDVRQVAQSLLVSRAAWGLAFLNAVDAGRIDPRTIPVETVRLLTIHANPAIGVLITKHWGSIEGASTAAVQAELTRLMALLDGAEGDPYPGKKLYMQTCGKCHTLHAQGGQVGPDLTTFKRDDVPRLLLNILNPSAEIREGFETHLVQLDDGRVVQGFLIEQDPQLLVLRGSDGQTTTIDRGGIEEHRILKQSLMPEGQLKTFTEEDVRNLFAYLRSAQPLND